MTLAQLQSFVLVARHGSVKAAAAELEVTEPAVSVAVDALRKELGDELFVRSGRGIALTPGGQRLAALAGEILGLAEQARRSVAEPPAGERWLVGEPQLNPTTGTGLFLERHGLAPAEVVACRDGAPALAAAQAGEGVALGLAHVARGRPLVRLDARHAERRGLAREDARRRPCAARRARAPALHHHVRRDPGDFTGRAGTAQGHARPKVHVTLWANR